MRRWWTATLVVPLALAVGVLPGSARPSSTPAGVYVLDTGIRVGYPDERGLYLVPLRGNARQVLSKRWIPAARSRGGLVAAFARGRKHSALFILSSPQKATAV